MSANEQLRPISTLCEEIACQIIPLGYMLDLKIKNPRVRKHHGGHKRYHLQKLLAGGYKSMAIISSMQSERNPQSFWNTPAMRARLERGGPMAACAKNAQVEALKSEALYKESKNNLNLNNISLKSNYSLKEDLNYSKPSSNLNDLKAPPEKPKGVARLELYRDDSLKKAMTWGVEEWLVQVCIQEYGLNTVKGQINRIGNIPDGYFKPQYGPIPQQRGRIFNAEMQKLRKAQAQ